MTIREDLHSLVDWLPECAWEGARQTLLEHLKKHDPVAYALYTAPEDDEPLTEEERAAIEEALEDTDPRNWLSHEEVKARLMNP